MLKPPANDPQPAAGADDERGIGEILHQLVDDGKAYARAELNLATAIATAKASALRLPAILFGAALLLAQAAVTVLAVAIYLSLLALVGPLFAGVLAFLIFAGAAAGLAWLGASKIRDAL